MGQKMLFLIILVLCSVTIYLHTQFLWLTGAMARRLVYLPPRSVLIAVVLLLLFAHLVEINLWAVGYYGTYHWFDIGGFKFGPHSYSFPEFFYYSSATYTSLGVGDLVPETDFELLTGLEALTGLMMITWSASFTYLIMQRIWPHQYD